MSDLTKTLSVHDHDHYTESGEHIVSHELSVRSIGQWLSKGTQDFMQLPGPSLFYGGMMMLLVMATFTTYLASPVLLFTVATSVIMIAPFLATGLYHLAHQLEENQPPNFPQSLFIWKNNLTEFALFALVLGVIIAIWGRITPLIAAVVKSNGLLIVNPDAGVTGFLMSDLGQEFALYFGIGAFFVSAFVFSISVVTVPLLLRDNNIGVINAMIISFQVTRENAGLMLAWMLTIGVLLTLGVATFGIGMLVIMPILAYASWHACMDLVDIDTGESRKTN
jgi:uncharacterized membrane protein